MQKRIGTKLYDTEKAELLGTKYVGEYGETTGYEEQLFITSRKQQHFLYGIGGTESPYIKPTIIEITDDEAAVWKKENIKKAKGREKSVKD